MKKAALMLVLVLSLGLTACGGSNGAGTENGAGTGSEVSTGNDGEQQTENESTEEQEENTVEAFTGKYIVNAEYVKENLDNIILIDARGSDAAENGTVKGAIALAWQYLATCEDGASGDANWGCILDTDRLSQRLSELGLAKDKEIVLFAAAQNGWGDDGRIAWELIAAGYENVKMVDGGYQALEAAGLELQKGGSEPRAAEVSVEAIEQTHTINTDELQADYDTYKVVDVRADEEYNGEVLYGEANGGHLPGAIHIRFTDLFKEDGALKSNAEITAMFEAAGLSREDKIVTYCTAGIRSAYMQLIMEMCGYENAKNYDESFYRWAAVGELE